MTSKTIAIALAGVAVVLAAAALIVVTTRTHEIVQAAPATTPEPVAVTARDVMSLVQEGKLRFTSSGAVVDDPELAARLHLERGDVIVALSGRTLKDASDVERVIMLGGNEVIAQVTHGGSTALARWRVDGGLDYKPMVVPTAPQMPLPPDPLLDTIVQDDDTHVHLPRATVETLLADPTKISAAARIVPAIRNGIPDGFKLYAIHPGSVAARLGLQNGDTIHAINGVVLTTAESALQAYTQLRNAVHLDVLITRRGKPLSIAIQIN